jgi:hypothetical protein
MIEFDAKRVFLTEMYKKLVLEFVENTSEFLCNFALPLFENKNERETITYMQNKLSINAEQASELLLYVKEHPFHITIQKMGE